MKLKELNRNKNIESDLKLNKVFVKYENLINELNTRELPEEIVNTINDGTETINSSAVSGKELRRLIRETQLKILKVLEKELKLVAKNHYRNLWLALGMSVFGIPLGVAFGGGSGNMSFIGTGMPIGMVIGIVIGSTMDKKAFENGRQLNVEC